MKTKRTLSALICSSALVLLAACGGGGDDPGTDPGTDPDVDPTPSFTQEELEAEAGAVYADAGALAARFEGEEAVVALEALTGLGLPSGFAATSELGVLQTGEALPRGEYVYDDAAGAWDLVDPSRDDLVLRWSFVDAGGGPHEAALAVDWAVSEGTVDASDGAGNVREVPTDANVGLSVDGAPVADLDAGAAWYACEDVGYVLEPTALSLDGYVGVGASVEFEEIGFELASDRAATSGAITAGDAADSATFAWDVSLDGTLEREGCFASDFAVDAGSVDFDLSSNVAGTERSIGIGFGFSDIDIAEDGGPVSVALSDGAIRVDGATAVAFDGTLDNGDGDEFPGENLTVRFAGGETTTLERLLEDADAATSALRTLSLLR